MKKLLLSITCLLLITFIYAQKTYIWCGTLIDGISNEPKKNMTIVVEKNKIVAIEHGFSSKTSASPAPAINIIDLKTKTVMPGWIDMHVHLEFETSPKRQIEGFTYNPADYAYQSVQFSEVTLLAGFTTVRDLAGSGVNISLRNAINKGWIKRRWTEDTFYDWDWGQMDDWWRS